MGDLKKRNTAVVINLVFYAQSTITVTAVKNSYRRHGETDRQTDREADRQTDKQTDRDIDRARHRRRPAAEALILNFILFIF